MDPILKIEKGQVAIILTPEDPDMISFRLFRLLDEGEEPTSDLLFTTGVALGMVGTAVNAPDLIAFMSEHGQEEPNQKVTPPPLHLVTLDGEHVDAKGNIRENQENPATPTNTPGNTPEGTGGYSRDIAAGTVETSTEPPDECA